MGDNKRCNKRQKARSRYYVSKPRKRKALAKNAAKARLAKCSVPPEGHIAPAAARVATVGDQDLSAATTSNDASDAPDALLPAPIDTTMSPKYLYSDQ